MPARSCLARPRVRSAARLIVIVSVVAVGVAACGGGGSSGSASGSASSSAQQGNGRRAGLRDPKVQACLKKQGVTLPSGRRPNGRPPSAGNGQPRTRPNGSPRNSAQFQKLREALQKCGVQFPNRGQNGAPPAPSQDTTTASAS
jgi:hypothetical protein